MIPVLYEGNEKSFISQGIGSLKDAVSCIVSEELNGSYELEMEYPIDGVHYSDIKLGRLILAEPAPQKETEPFFIYKISKPIGGIVTVNAEHISYRLSYIPVKPFSASSCIAAMNGLISNSIEDCPFTVWTDKNINSQFNLAIPQSFRLCLGGIEGSILDVFKGEYEFNRFIVKLHTHRGSLKDSAKIIYGRNLIDLVQEETIEKTITGIIPYWKGSVTISNSDNTTTTTERVVTLPEYIVKSAYSGKYPYERTIVYDFSSDFQSEPTVDELRKRCKEYMEANLTGVPDVTLTISFAMLSEYEENKGFSDQVVYLGDSVPVLFDKYDIATTAKVVSFQYDTIEERYNQITLGSTSASLSKSLSEFDQKQEEKVSRSDLEISLALAQKVITGGSGGYKVTTFINGHPSETVYGDTDDINTMTNCLRVNRNGIGFSHEGYNGPYISAWTIDGKFNADFITTGTLSANLIKAGLLTNKDGSFWVNFDTNEFYLAGMAKTSDLDELQKEAESYADQSSQNALNSLTQQDVFNRLTNGGQTQGLALVDGKLYINAEYLVSKIIQGLTISGSTVQGSRIVFGDPNGTYRIEAVYKEQSTSVGGYKPKGVLFNSFSPDASAMYITDHFIISEYSNDSLQMLSLMKNVYSMLSSFADGGGRADVYASVSSGTPSAILRALSSSGQANFLTVKPDCTQLVLKSNSRIWNFMNNDGSLRLRNGNKDYINIYTDANENCHIRTSSVCYINGFPPVRVNGSYHDIYFQWNGASLIATVDATQVWSTSDERLKHDVKNISDEYVDAIGSVSIKEFIFSDEIYDQSIKHFGVIAQEVRNALESKGINPEEIAVNGHFERDDEEYYTVDKSEFMMARIACVEKKIKALEQKNADLESRLQRLEELMNANNQN